MKHKALSVVFLFLLISSFLSYASRYTPYHNAFISSDEHKADLQTETPPTKDYMDRLMERDTDPLGLKENKSLNQLLGQPQIKWVIRSEQRHILN
ncbi:hypothetical protein ACFLRX_01835 [Acidobacteriota bacterium]